MGLSAGATVVEPFEASMKTLPSGGDLATETAAISPLAPARFSTTTERFSRSPMPGAMMRARRSFGPPGGKPTTKRSGRSGKSVSSPRGALVQRQGDGTGEGGAAGKLGMVGHARLDARDAPPGGTTCRLRKTGMARCTTSRRPGGAMARASGETILFHHGIGACAEIWAGWLPTLVDPIASSASTCAAAGVRTFRRRISPGRSICWSRICSPSPMPPGLQRFHLVGELIGGTVALAAALARPQRIATLTVSNGAHLGASIQASRPGAVSSTRAA